MVLTRRFAFILMVLMTVLALSFAACGGDDDDDSGDDAATATSAQDAGDDEGGDDEETAEADDDEGDDEGDDDDEASPEGDDDDDDGPSEGDIDVCEVVSPEEAGDALGVPVDDGASSHDGDDIYECEWNAAAETDVATLYLEVRTGSDEDRQGYYDLIDAEAVPDLGEEAKWNEGLSLLEVMGDDYYLSVQLLNFSFDDEETKTRSIDFADLVLGKLGE